MTDPVTTARRFNDTINARDADGLADLMTDDHRFVDVAGTTVVGRSACLEAWRSFFDTFPTYRNEFATVEERNGVVVITGRSVCRDHPDLDGPAIWTARVVGSAVAEWRVHDATAAVRARLGLSPD